MNQTDLTTGAGSTADRGPLAVSVGQFTAVADVDANLDVIDALAAEAAGAGSDLLVLPEASIYAWDAPRDRIAEVAAQHGERFVERAGGIARRRGLALIVGGYVPGAEGKPYNRLTAIGPDGGVLSVYDKVHLYDAYSWMESDSVAPGPVRGDFSELGVFDLRGWRVGMLNCYDLRFPEIARGLTERGADLITMSSAWVVGPLKEFHLATLAAARAIETTSFVAIANQGGARSTGRSAVLSPFGSTVGTVDLEQGVAHALLTDEVLRSCREQLPIRANRRYAATGAARPA